MRFKFFKYICILVFIVILVLFTIGYSSQPILNLTATASINLELIPTIPKVTINIPTLPNNGNFKFSLYMNKIVNNTDDSIINYKDIDSTLDNISKISKYVLIGVSICIVLIILLSLIGLKTISYIPLIIALITMIIFCIIIVIIYSTNFVIDLLKKYISSQTESINLININNMKINYDNGGVFITIATILLFINYFLYVVLG
jgi:hypothetical protein